MIIQKSTVIPPSSMVLFNFAFVILFVLVFMLCLGGMGRSFNHNHSTQRAPFLGSLGSDDISIIGQESSKSKIAGTGISQCWHSFVSVYFPFLAPTISLMQATERSRTKRPTLDSSRQHSKHGNNIWTCTYTWVGNWTPNKTRWSNHMLKVA